MKHANNSRCSSVNLVAGRVFLGFCAWCCVDAFSVEGVALASDWVIVGPNWVPVGTASSVTFSRATDSCYDWATHSLCVPGIGSAWTVDETCEGGRETVVGTATLILGDHEVHVCNGAGEPVEFVGKVRASTWTTSQNRIPDLRYSEVFKVGVDVKSTGYWVSVALDSVVSVRDSDDYCSDGAGGGCPGCWAHFLPRGSVRVFAEHLVAHPVSALGWIELGTEEIWTGTVEECAAGMKGCLALYPDLSRDSISNCVGGAGGLELVLPRGEFWAQGFRVGVEVTSIQHCPGQFYVSAAAGSECNGNTTPGLHFDCITDCDGFAGSRWYSPMRTGAYQQDISELSLGGGGGFGGSESQYEAEELLSEAKIEAESGGVDGWLGTGGGAAQRSEDAMPGLSVALGEFLETEPADPTFAFPLPAVVGGNVDFDFYEVYEGWKASPGIVVMRAFGTVIALVFIFAALGRVVFWGAGVESPPWLKAENWGGG